MIDVCYHLSETLRLGVWLGFVIIILKYGATVFISAMQIGAARKEQ